MDQKLPSRGLFHLCVVYVLWSTTYMGMRVGVGPSSGFPPFFFGAMRFPLAALILLGIARFQGLNMRPTGRELISLCIIGNIFWLVGHGLILWSAQYADSGFVCLMASTVPIWAALLQVIIYKKRPSVSMIVSLLIGFLGIAVLSLSSPAQMRGAGPSVIAALLIGAFGWALGSAVQARMPVALDTKVTAGYHQLAAGFGFLAVSLLLGEPAPHPTISAWVAWGYLVVFGSVFAFTSFVIILKLLPINIAMTYAYVNPVLALFLGWALLGEQITLRVVLGAALVLLSVFSIFNVRQAPRAPAES